MKINTLVYEECLNNDIPLPSLPVLAPRIFGQCGEDLIVASLLKAIALKKDKDLKEMTFLEIGGNCPISTSATYLLAKDLEMKGVIVEANPALIDNLRRVRNDSNVLHFAVTPEKCSEAVFYVAEFNEVSSLWESFVDKWPKNLGGVVADTITVPAITLPEIIDTYFNDGVPDFLSLDVEGMDFLVLKSMDFNKHRPKIIQIEPSNHFNAFETERIKDFLHDKEYSLISKTDVNCIYLDNNAY